MLLTILFALLTAETAAAQLQKFPDPAEFHNTTPEAVEFKQPKNKPEPQPTTLEVTTAELSEEAVAVPSVNSVVRTVKRTASRVKKTVVSVGGMVLDGVRDASLSVFGAVLRVFGVAPEEAVEAVR